MRSRWPSRRHWGGHAGLGSVCRAAVRVKETKLWCAAPSLAGSGAAKGDSQGQRSSCVTLGPPGGTADLHPELTVPHLSFWLRTQPGPKGKGDIEVTYTDFLPGLHAAGARGERAPGQCSPTLYTLPSTLCALPTATRTEASGGAGVGWPGPRWAAAPARHSHSGRICAMTG